MGFCVSTQLLEQVLKRYYIDNSQPLTNPMVVRHLEAGNEQFWHYKKYEKLLGPEVPYFSGIGAIMYIVSNTIKI